MAENESVSQAPLPQVRFVGAFAGGRNLVYEIYMPDGNMYRYTWGEMIPFNTNKPIEP